MRITLLGIGVALAAMLIQAGCFEEREACAQEAQDVVHSIPWGDEDRAEYVLLDGETMEECGTGLLEIERQGDQYELTLEFEGEGDSDQSVVVVDAETLRPNSIRRQRTIDDEIEIVEGEYDPDEEVVRIVEITDGEERTIPRRLDEETYYDNESSLFLWRTIDFEIGYEASYRAVLVNQGGTQQVITLEVVEREQITVPAGTFDAWRVEIRFADVDQVAWYADTPERPLVQYDNSVQLLQLTGITTP
ncbi:MAG: DUF3108 domain-containing protein [Dehalococcoidia bacterium]